MRARNHTASVPLRIVIVAIVGGCLYGLLTGLHLSAAVWMLIALATLAMGSGCHLEARLGSWFTLRVGPEEVSRREPPR